MLIDELERGVRDIVIALREHGINTTCSCHHKGYIQAESYDAELEVNIIYNVLVEHGIVDYTAVLTCGYHGGRCYRTWEIRSSGFKPAQRNNKTHSITKKG